MADADTPAPVLPAKAGIHTRNAKGSTQRVWIPDQIADDDGGGRRPFLLTLALLLAALLPAPALAGQSAPKRCYLAIDGKTLVDNRCLVFPLDHGGYTLNTWDKGKPRRSHFAQVNADPGGTGTASWNADPNDDRALDPLGRVRLVHGCWVNRRARICAR